jgi:general secretion pathway protein D
MYSISRRYNVSVEELSQANGMSAPYIISPGQSLRVPGAEAKAAGATRKKPTKASSPAKGGGAPGRDENIRIIANDTNNSLVILATGTQYRDIEGALKQLDTIPLQVLIEATIAEVRLVDSLKYGVKWFFDTGNTSVTLSDVASGAVNSVFPGFSVLFSSSADVRVVLDALDEVTDLNVVSSPQLLVVDNRTAELQVGDQVPVATQSAVNTIDPDAPIVNSIEFRDTGVLLKVTPRVNSSGLVNLEIQQEVSDVVETTTSGIDSPTIQQRRIKSWVSVHSGETVALGGLIRDRSTKSTAGVPGLSRIPLLGALFGTHDEGVDRTELLVLITPRVVRNAKQARDITKELRRQIQTLKPKKPWPLGPIR